MWGIQRWPPNSSHKWPVTRKIFPFDDVIMHPPPLYLQLSAARTSLSLCRSKHSAMYFSADRWRFSCQYWMTSNNSHKFRFINTLWPIQNGRYFANDVSKCKSRIVLIMACTEYNKSYYLNQRRLIDNWRSNIKWKINQNLCFSWQKAFEIGYYSSRSGCFNLKSISVAPFTNMV